MEWMPLITDPTIAYILLLIGFYGIFFEFANPGFVMPGVVGTIALLLALYAFHLLPVNYVGLSLLLVGIMFMAAELYISSFGILGLGGVIAFILGSFLLFDSGVFWGVILLMSVLTVLFFIILFILVIRSQKNPVITGREAIIDAIGEVIEMNNETVMIRVLGELWIAKSKSLLKVGDKVKVKKIHHLILHVEPIKGDDR